MQADRANIRFGGVRLVVAIAALLSLGWQSLVVQTHVHPGFWTAAQPAGLHRAQEVCRPDGGRPSDDPADCPICRQLAQAGSFLLPLSPACRPPLSAAFRLLLPPFVRWQARQRSHAWRSRGPPQSPPNR